MDAMVLMSCSCSNCESTLQKNAFEWGLSMIPHSEDAVQVTLNMLQVSLSGRDTTRYTSLTATIIQVCKAYMPWISRYALYDYKLGDID
ncbi:hypothetical protein RHMOL_Rhmol06G0265100 [Rhododendron molle]|uniref:Uncharacterized protein n=1 Tax=Rhododendron molle TaxID=49168 RepID=A0ACC0NHY2_RHOML|nr:hypothetical protein RHMOL_Rhmol06G0265100 [Rhododendron molle]